MNQDRPRARIYRATSTTRAFLTSTAPGAGRAIWWSRRVANPRPKSHQTESYARVPCPRAGPTSAGCLARVRRRSPRERLVCDGGSSYPSFLLVTGKQRPSGLLPLALAGRRNYAAASMGPANSSLAVDACPGFEEVPDILCAHSTLSVPSSNPFGPVALWNGSRKFTIPSMRSSRRRGSGSRRSCSTALAAQGSAAGASPPRPQES